MLLDAFLRAPDEGPSPTPAADPAATSQLRAAAGLADEPAAAVAPPGPAETPVTTFSHGYREAPQGGSRTLFVAHGVEERVSRLERLLSADLDRLGAAAVSDRLGHLRTAVEALTNAVTAVANERANETEQRLEKLFGEMQSGLSVLARHTKALSEQVAALVEADQRREATLEAINRRVNRPLGAGDG